MESKMTSPHSEKFGRYFIAIIPPQPACEKIEQFKNHIKDRYKSKAALNSPPHITLHMPFEWKASKEAVLCDRLKNFFDGMQSLEVDLLNFSCFAPKTIFVNVTTNKELERMEKELYGFCKKELNLFNARYQDLPFHPHVTIAFRDLRKAAFGEAWNEFKDKKFAEKFKVVKVALLKHNGKLWEPLRYYSLN